jgi:hypothetical protein
MANFDQIGGPIKPSGQGKNGAFENTDCQDFKEQGIDYKLYYSEGESHSCTDTVDKMNWEVALGWMQEGFDDIWNAAQN